MTYYKTTDVSQIWRGLGTFWNNFPGTDKALIEQLWEGYLQTVDNKNTLITALRNSTNFTNLSPVITSYNEAFDVVYSGISVYSGIVNTKFINNNYVYYFNDGRQILNLSGLTNLYWSSDNSTLTRVGMSYGNQYTVSADGLRIEFLNKPPITPDQGNSYYQRGLLFASGVQYLNPVLFNIYGDSIGLGVDSFINSGYINYNLSYTANQMPQQRMDLAVHYKNLIGALSSYKLQKPTLLNFERALGIAKGLPFTYNSGVISSITDYGAYKKIVVGADNLYCPSGMTLAYSVGDVVPRWAPIVSGANLYDWVNGPSLFSDIYLNPAQYKATLIYSLQQPLLNSTYDRKFYYTYVSGLIPKGMQFAEIATISGLTYVTLTPRHMSLLTSWDLLDFTVGWSTLSAGIAGGYGIFHT